MPRARGVPAGQYWSVPLDSKSDAQPVLPRRRAVWAILVKIKIKTGHMYSAFSWVCPPLKRSERHVLTRDYTVLPAIHTLIHEWNEPSCLWSPAAAHHHHRTSAGTHFTSHRWLETELAQAAGYIPGWYPAQKRSPIPVPTDRYCGGQGSKFTTIRSQVRRPNQLTTELSLIQFILWRLWIVFLNFQS